MSQVTPSAGVQTALARILGGKPSMAIMGTATAALAVLVAGATLSSPVTLTVTLAVSGVLLAWGWAGALGLPSPYGTTAVLVGATLAVLLAPYLAHAESAPGLEYLPMAVALSLIASFVHQVARRDGRPRLTVSLAGTALGILVLASAASLLPLAASGAGPTPESARVTAAAMVAVVVTLALSRVRYLPGGQAWMVPLAMAVGGMAGFLGALAFSAPLSRGALAGVMAAGMAEGVRTVLLTRPQTVLPRPQLTVAVASVLATGGVVNLAARIMIG